MDVHLGFAPVAARLLLTTLFAGLLGLDRSEHGRAAGIRTTLLVSLAACASMLQANLLMASAGKASDSFVVLDLMRFPLGILTGVGFIGAGAIVRGGDRNHGVTTAATLWFATVMGLCVGGGQLLLGSMSFALGALVLWPLRWVERKLPPVQHATLGLKFHPGMGHDLDSLRRALLQSHIGIMSCAVDYANNGRLPTGCRLRLKGTFPPDAVPPPVGQLASDPTVAELNWET